MRPFCILERPAKQQYRGKFWIACLNAETSCAFPLLTFKLILPALTQAQTCVQTSRVLNDISKTTAMIGVQRDGTLNTHRWKIRNRLGAYTVPSEVTRPSSKQVSAFIPAFMPQIALSICHQGCTLHWGKGQSSVVEFEKGLGFIPGIAILKVLKQQVTGNLRSLRTVLTKSTKGLQHTGQNSEVGNN